MSAGLAWARDGRDWPNRETSRFVETSRTHWHVQVSGVGPTLLLLHGTASATHSFRDLAPLLARHFTVVAPDLPGHGFTSTRGGSDLSLPSMAGAVAELLSQLDLPPAYAVGHSAGAAVAVRMALDGTLTPRRIVALAGALTPFPGAMAHVAPGLAKLLFLNPLAPRVFAFMAGEDTVARTLGNMGSRIDRRGLALYTRLMRNPAHLEAALGMMARWNLAALARDLPRLAVPLTLLHGVRDRAVPPKTLDAIRRSLSEVEIQVLPNLGHLLHEEDPARIAAALLSLAERDSVLRP